MTLEDFLKLYDAETDLWVTMIYPNTDKTVRIVYDMEMSLHNLKRGGDSFGWCISNNDVPLHKDWRESTIIKINPANKFGEAKLVCVYEG